MKLPIQVQPILRGVSTNRVKSGDGVNPSFDWGCAIDCAAGLAQCALSPSPASCLVNAGLSKCVRCFS
jgi:hypothetical protein